MSKLQYTIEKAYTGNTIGETIAKERKKQKLTIRELGELSGTSAATVCRIEKGTREHKIKTARKIFAALGLADDLLFQEKYILKYTCCRCGKEYEVDENKYHPHHPCEFFIFDLIDSYGTKINICEDCCFDFCNWMDEIHRKERNKERMI